MQIRYLLVMTTIVLSACSIPFTTSKDDRKATCDRIAASAIQTASAEDAKNLAAKASSCYAEIQTH